MGSTKVYDSVVVGAGLSGLAAGDALTAAGADNIVLEANDYPGGRIRTIRYGSLYAEAGGMIVTDEDTAALALLNELSIPLSPPWGRHGSELFLDGRIVTLGGDAGSPHDLETIAGVAEVLANISPVTPGLPAFSPALFIDAYRKATDEIGNESKMIDFPYSPDLRDKWDSITFADFLDGFDPHLRPYFDLQLKATAGESVDLISLFWGVITTQWNADNNFYAVSGGTGRLAARLFERLDGRVRLRCQVRSVVADNGLAKVSYLENGVERQIRSRTVIMATLPQTVLSVVAGLDSKKQDALKKVTFGNYIPVHMHFGERFWADWIKTGYLNCAGLVFADLVDATRDQSGREGVLIGFIAGKEARELSETRDDAIISAVLRDLDRVFPGKAAGLIRAQVFNWRQAIPYLGTNYAPVLKELQRPQVNIFFCGDYTYGAGINEAIYSGQIAARDVMYDLRR